jgi:hypothetical protein
MRRSTCTHLLATMFLMAMSVISTILSMASSKPLVLGLSTSPRLSLLMGSLLVSMILLFSFTLPHGRTLILLYVDDMLITGMILSILPLFRLVLVSSFTCLTWVLLATFLGLRSHPLLTTTTSQRKYIHDLLDRIGLTDHCSVDTPI